MMAQQRCSECGTSENLKIAKDYPELAELLKFWNSLQTAGFEVLCPDCAADICESLREKKVRICRLDPSDTSKRKFK